MKKIFIITISLTILVLTGVFGIGIENAFATVCNQLVEIEDKDNSSVYIKNVTIAARPSKGNIIKCVTDISGECTLKGLLEHTSYTIIIEQNSIPAEYECAYCEYDIVACVSKKTFKLKKIATSEPEPTPAPVFQADNLVDLTSIDRCKTCTRTPCITGSCHCNTCCDDEGNCSCCGPCSCTDCTGQPCPIKKIREVYGNLEGHYKNVESDYNIILNSFEQIKKDAESIKDSYKKINSLENINGWIVENRNQEISEKLDYCRSKMNLCFSQLHEYEIIEKEEVVREILIPCQIGKDENLTGAEYCYGFDMEHLDRAENMLCYHKIGEISLDELAEEEPEPELDIELEPEANVVLGQIWLDIHKYTYETWCRDKNKKNPSNIGYVKDPNKCCKKHYENSIETKLIDTVRHPDANHYWEKYNCLGY